MSIKVKNLSKVYGSQAAIDGINFEIQQGEIVGFLGPNGAGKSTTMKILTGYLTPTSGEAYILDSQVEIDNLDLKKRIGYLPEHNPLYLEMYVRDYLMFNGELYGLKGAILKQKVEQIIQLVGLLPESHKKIVQLSKGYRQRVGLAQALLHDPEVLILDEPTTGLDPNQLSEIRALIKQIGQNKTVVLSTHIMQEVEAICDRVIVIHKGKIVSDEPLNSLLEKYGNLEKAFTKLTN
ncbi:MAG: ATP-binding cassette domain-containing protein [Leadbetterella sp.]